MTCRYCGSDLPSDALFCGECGRAVLVESLVGANSVGDSSDDLSEAYARFAPPPELVEPTASALHCPQCDSLVDDADVFCGECGFVLKAMIPGPRDTAVVDAVEAPWPFAEAAFTVDDDSPEDLEPAPALDQDPPQDAPPPDSESQPRKDPNMPENEQDELAPAGARSRTIPDPFPWGADIDDDAEDVEATRIVSANGGGDRFVLQFSTGESVTVSGAGLIGRNPAAQPGEYVDQLVSIFDVGKSVSKTHLEFGQEGGRFWVSDRYSTNGSIVRQPEAEPRRCEPGRRYFVVRGTRIDVGEQFFVVS
jgi:hypothetical protein